ncbi:MAG: excinuclease ABC subunit UvrA [Chloroflexota bacterium]
MASKNIVIRGAKEHNLKDVDLSIPRNKMVVFTGVSGSGKSSLAFDTLYAEGQRRYVESLSAYARQFLGQMEKPKVDYIGGLSPAIAIEQKAVSKNPRSTVGTVTEVYDYLRVLFARIGVPHCPNCGREVKRQSAQQIVEQIANLPAQTRFQVLAPVARGRKGTFEDVFTEAQASGFSRARINGTVTDLDQREKLDKKYKHNIELVVDRLVTPSEAEPEFESRLNDSVETALTWGDGLLFIDIIDGEELIFSEQNSCGHCGLSFPELTPQMFSFNSPQGMCMDCNGLGLKQEFDPDLFYIPDRSILDGAVVSWGELRKKKNSWPYKIALQMVDRYKIDLETPWHQLPKKVRDLILYGDPKVKFRYESENFVGNWPFEGVIKSTKRRYRETQSSGMREYYTQFLSQQPCPTCHAKRLRPEATAVTIGALNVHQVTSLSIEQAFSWVQALRGELGKGKTLTTSDLDLDDFETPQEITTLHGEAFEIAGEVLKEIHDRLNFMLNVGLYYLTLDRPAPTLSGGEGQRIRLASQIGSGLVGVMYILDEPSIGLHQRDNRRLLDSLLNLRDLGNTVIVVEHDEETMDSADMIVDFGPGAGVHGGEIVFKGTPTQIKKTSKSLTGQYMSGKAAVHSPRDDRRVNGHWLSIEGLTQNNLKNVSAKFPVGCFTCVTGVSGSGKSSLVTETLYPALSRILHQAQSKPGSYQNIEGMDAIDKVIHITQTPIGRTPRSNPITYVKGWDAIRTLFSQTPEASLRGYKPGRFSFNVKGGRCENCSGYGQKLVEMHFLPDVWVICDVCKGSRFNRETLQIKWKGLSIAEVLELDVGSALEIFSDVPRINRILQTLHDVGLDYIKLGQSATTLSGGEAQRVKLAKELSRVATGDTLYILDEPTTGLHFADIQKLLDVLHRLTDAGNTVIVIEHNLDVIKTADWIIDLGPEGGEAGGQIIASGTPEKVAQNMASHTGQYLAKMLNGAIAA